MASFEQLAQNFLTLQTQQLELIRSIHRHVTGTTDSQPSAAAQWQKANPFLARSCREAAETLNKVYNQWLTDLTEEIVSKSEELVGNEFTRNELIDKHAVRLSQFATMLTNLQLLGGTAPQAQPR
jgi:hypothetical protein